MRKSRFAAEMLLTMVMMLSVVPVYADSTQVSTNSVNINVNSIPVVATGESFVLQNNSEVPFSILYKGTTYLPMRKVCEFLNKDIVWDSKTKTAAIANAKTKIVPVATTKKAEGGKAQSLDVSQNSINISINGKMMVEAGEAYNLADGTKVPFTLVYEGTTYLPMRKMSDMVGKNITWHDKTRAVEIADIADLKMYKEFPGVPDFSQFAGKAAVELTYKDGVLVDIYAEADDIKIAMEKYLGILFDRGYSYKESIEKTEEGVKLYSDVYTSGDEKNIVMLTLAGEDTYETITITNVR